MSRYLIDPAGHAAFSTDRASKADLVRGERMFLGLNCFEPGQTQRVHAHAGADKFYLVLSGKARMAVGDDQFDAGPGALVWAPAEIPHGVVSVAERTVMMIGMAPPP